MAEKTKIAWTRSTFNPFIGCTKIGPGCDHCYAEAQDSRKRWGGTTHWGVGVPRMRTSEQNWNKVMRWERLAAEEKRTGHITPGHEWARPGFWPVFCASLADVFDNEVPQVWRDDLFYLISQTPNLSWLLVTKRIGNVAKMMHPSLFDNLPNIRLLITVVNQEEADRDIPKLLALPCKNGISYEPALGSVDWWQIPVPGTHGDMCDMRDFGWIIVGGESKQSGHEARPFQIEWARSSVAQCKAAGVPVFMKQLGSNIGWNGMQNADNRWPGAEPNREDTGKGYWRVRLIDRAGADPAEWPEDLRVRRFPEDEEGRKFIEELREGFAA